MSSYFAFGGINQCIGRGASVSSASSTLLTATTRNVINASFLSPFPINSRGFGLANANGNSKFYGYPSALQGLFGAGAIQNSSTVIIKKAGLPGLTPRFDNTAESLLVGLLLNLIAYAKGDETGKIEANLWEVKPGNYSLNTIVIFLRARVTVVDKYEISDFPNAINPNDY